MKCRKGQQTRDPVVCQMGLWTTKQWWLWQKSYVYWPIYAYFDLSCPEWAYWLVSHFIWIKSNCYCMGLYVSNSMDSWSALCRCCHRSSIFLWVCGTSGLSQAFSRARFLTKSTGGCKQCGGLRSRWCWWCEWCLEVGRFMTLSQVPCVYKFLYNAQYAYDCIVTWFEHGVETVVPLEF